MKITPIEIRQKQFEKAFRGYEKEEVDAYLLSLSQEWERVMTEHLDMRKRVENAEAEVIRLREVENSLFRTLKTAEETGNHLIDSANKSAELHLREAQMNADAMINEAKSKAKSLIENAEEKSKQIIEDLYNEVKNLERSYYYLDDQKESLLQNIKNLVGDLGERVSRYGGNSSRNVIAEKIKELKSLTIGLPVRTAPKERPQNNIPAENTYINDPKSEEETSGSFFDKI